MPDISKIKAPDSTIYNLLSKKTKGVIRCETDSTSTATAFKVTVSGITELYDGLTLLIKNTKITSSAGCTLQVNDLAAKRIICSKGGGYVTTHWALSATYLFVYNVTDGRWEMQQGYWSDNNTWRSIKVDGTSLLGTSITTGAINFVSGDNVTLTGSGNDITISASGGSTVEQVSYGTSTPLSSEGSDKDLYFKVSATSGMATVDIRVVHAEMDAKTVTFTITHGSNILYTSTPTTNAYAVYNSVSDTFLGDDGTSHTIQHHGIRTYNAGEACNEIILDNVNYQVLCQEPNSSYPWDYTFPARIAYVGGYDTVENGYLKAGDDWIDITANKMDKISSPYSSGDILITDTNGNSVEGRASLGTGEYIYGGSVANSALHANNIIAHGSGEALEVRGHGVGGEGSNIFGVHIDTSDDDDSYVYCTELKADGITVGTALTVNGVAFTDKVSKSGDTMTGQLLNTNGGVKTVSLIDYNSSVDASKSNNGVSSYTNYGLYIQDKNSKNLAKYGVTATSDGYTFADIYAHAFDSNGNSKSNELQLKVNKSGKQQIYTNCPDAWRQALGIGGLRKFEFESWHNGFIFRTDNNNVYVFVPGWYGDTSGTISATGTAEVQWKGLTNGTFTATSLSLSNVNSRAYGTEFVFTRPSTVSNNATGIVGLSSKTISW